MNNGTIELLDFDFTNHREGTFFSHDRIGGVVDQVDIGPNGMFLRMSVDRGLPYSGSVGVTVDENTAYPYFYFVAESETETVEDLDQAIVPDWIPGPETDASVKAKLLPRIAKVAEDFTSGLNHAWPHLGALSNDRCKDLNKQNNAQRVHIDKFDNVTNFFTLWIGYCWKRVNMLGDSSNRPLYNTHKYVETIVDQLEKQMGQDPTDWRAPDPKLQAQRFYHGHDASEWTLALKNADTEGARRICRLGKFGKCGPLVFDLNAAHTKDGVLNSVAAKAEFHDLATAQYEAALESTRNLIEIPEFKDGVKTDYSIKAGTIKNIPLSDFIEYHDHESFHPHVAKSSDSSKVAAGIVNNSLKLGGIAVGTETVTLTASNYKGSVNLVLNVVVTV